MYKRQGRSDTAQRVADMVFGAMSQVVPHKVLAGSNSSITGVYFGGVDPKTHEYYVYMAVSYTHLLEMIA